jgi:hypothetical protein
MDIIREPNLTGRKIKKRTVVLLTEKWSAWEAGQAIEMEAEKANRVIAKGYGEVYKPSREPNVETAMAEPNAEKAVVTPDPEAATKDKKKAAAKVKKKGGAD